MVIAQQIQNRTRYCNLIQSADKTWIITKHRVVIKYLRFRITVILVLHLMVLNSTIKKQEHVSQPQYTSTYLIKNHVFSVIFLLLSCLAFNFSIHLEKNPYVPEIPRVVDQTTDPSPPPPLDPRLFMISQAGQLLALNYGGTEVTCVCYYLSRAHD